jgi:hypothetical protein
VDPRVSKIIGIGPVNPEDRTKGDEAMGVAA